MKMIDDVLDRAAIADLIDEGDDLLVELIAIFERETPRNLRAMSDALARGDTRTIATTAHKMKGTAATFGAVRMRELAERINRVALAGSAAELAELLRRFGPECDRVSAALRAERAKLSNPNAATPGGAAGDS